ncbi:MAG TPA: hypothetical protein VHT74_04070 [Acetobacteraceae bacterium]|jgi:hypothetical protein|nr:hypothetical protein [Acetobacteraceae bacterium]
MTSMQWILSRTKRGSRSPAAALAGAGAALLLLLMAGCSQPKPDEAPHEAAGPVAPPPSRPAPRQVRATWSFDSRSEECIATAAGSGMSLRVTVRRNAPIAISLSLPANMALPATGRAPIPLRFAGPAGRWQVAAQQTASHQLAVTMGSGDTALSHVLVLLSGGVLDIGTTEQIIASVTIPASDLQGQLWFDCARSRMI